MTVDEIFDGPGADIIEAIIVGSSNESEYQLPRARGIRALNDLSDAIVRPEVRVLALPAVSMINGNEVFRLSRAPGGMCHERMGDA